VFVALAVAVAAASFGNCPDTPASCPVNLATAEISETALCNRSVGYSNLQLASDTPEILGYPRKLDVGVAAVVAVVADMG